MSRGDQDAFALRSQQKAAAARGDRPLRTSRSSPVEIPQKKGEPKRFDDGRVHSPGHDARDPGQAEAGVSRRRRLGDGGQLVGAQRRRRGAAHRVGGGRERALSATPLARIVATAVAGVEPRIMGMGPVPSSRRALGAGEALARPDGRDRAERGVRGAVAGVPARARHRRRRSARESERRRDRARPSAGDVGRAPAAHRGARAREDGQAATRSARCASASGQGMATIIERV